MMMGEKRVVNSIIGIFLYPPLSILMVNRWISWLLPSARFDADGDGVISRQDWEFLVLKFARVFCGTGKVVEISHKNPGWICPFSFQWCSDVFFFEIIRQDSGHFVELYNS